MADEHRYIKLTARMCWDLRDVFVKADYDGSEYAWERVKDHLDAGAESKSGTRLELKLLPVEAKEHLLKLMKIVEGETFHKQASYHLHFLLMLVALHILLNAHLKRIIHISIRFVVVIFFLNSFG